MGPQMRPMAARCPLAESQAAARGSAPATGLGPPRRTATDAWQPVYPINIFITTYITTKPEIALTDNFRPLESAG